MLSIDAPTVATMMDCASTANNPSFETCTLQQGIPCVPVTASSGTPGSTIKIVNAIAVLAGASTLTRGIGGLISITDAANTILPGNRRVGRPLGHFRDPTMPVLSKTSEPAVRSRLSCRV